MTAKDKAQELLSKYISVQDKWYFKDLVDGLRISHAKQCALLAVYEIIAANPHSNPFNISVYSTMDFWLEVRNEIIKL